jgi:hypothetical protein
LEKITSSRKPAHNPGLRWLKTVRLEHTCNRDRHRAGSRSRLK